ncbi:kelch-like protein 10 [Hippoglossus stenolepis]|uniref:kelch-like protein 10 n=1 Tax=Hippoglossus stenolepis TaxID=195615 RepID=UPI00159C2325|nr:kelch-like protein 10 [Hippoglossus stenolepis]
MKETQYNLLAGLFCDAILEVEDVQFPIHRITLYECSLYFQALFKLRTTTGQVFHIPLVSPDILRIIIEFAYTGSVASTEDNVQELMMTADMLNIVGIIKACSHFIGEHLCPQNCVGIWQFTNICHSSELRCKAFRYIIQHFEEVVPSEEFLQLSVEELTVFIGKDELNVRIESIVFEAILRWIAHIPREREQHIAVLLSQVRLGLTSKEYIVNKVITNMLVQNNLECKKIENKSLQMIWHKNSRRSLRSGLSNTLARPRVPNSVLLSSGGWSDGNPICDIETYDFPADLWINISDKLEYPRAYHGTVFLNGYVYFLGGFDRVEYFNNVVRLDLSTHTWQEVAPMHYRRCYVSVTVLNGFIYALGGSDGLVRLNTAERYCPETNQWTLIAPMYLLRSDASCTVLHGKIYICGGFTGTECLQTAEYYDPEINQWTMTSPMSTNRSGLSATAYNNQIYVVGGCDGHSRLATAETYNSQTNTWHQLSPMLTRRSNFCLDVIHDKIYVVGGYDGSAITQMAEVYNPRTNVWYEISMPDIPRSGASSCVVTGILNMADYTLSRDSLPYLNLDIFDENSWDSD